MYRETPVSGQGPLLHNCVALEKFISQTSLPFLVKEGGHKLNTNGGRK